MSDLWLTLDTETRKNKSVKAEVTPSERWLLAGDILAARPFGPSPLSTTLAPHFIIRVIDVPEEHRDWIWKKLEERSRAYRSRWGFHHVSFGTADITAKLKEVCENKADAAFNTYFNRETPQKLDADVPVVSWSRLLTMMIDKTTGLAPDAEEFITPVVPRPPRAAIIEATIKRLGL